jgi:AraC family transcriptional regulator, transcriptional activator of pobA
MVAELPVFTLINPQNGNLAFKFMVFNDGSSFDHVQRHNYYSLIWVKQGSGKVRADFKEYDLSANSLFAFSPYQPFIFLVQHIRGVALFFHPDFFCIHKHQTEIACNGVLFNNIYEPPFIGVSEDTSATLDDVLTQIRNEIQNTTLAQHEILVSYLKIFLIHCSRLKTEQAPLARIDLAAVREPFILQNLKDAIEKNFKTKHSAGEYANELNISIKALAKATKTYFNRTITELISERIIIEAKRELYLTNKTVKEIAYGLGYDDEYYFSRFFKVNTDISPQLYRETVGFGRGAA